MNKIGKGKEGTLIILFLILMIAIIRLKLFFIDLMRFLFWIDSILLPISFISSLFLLFIIFTTPDYDKQNHYFTLFVCVIVFFLSLITINFAYDKGYSDNAIRNKAELENQLQGYTLILSIYTGEFRAEVTGMVVSEFQNALCEASPNTDCKVVIDSYNAYQNLVGLKDNADTVANIWK